MFVTESGIVTDVRPLHPKNALVPMLKTLFGSDMVVRPLHPENALFSMRVTPAGIMMDLRPVQP